MSRLESRKRALLAKSEQNRAELVADLVLMSSSVRALGEKAKTFRLVATSAATLVAGLTAFRKRRKQEAKAKTSWPGTILAGASLAYTIWLAVQSQKSGSKDASKTLTAG